MAESRNHSEQRLEDPKQKEQDKQLTNWLKLGKDYFKANANL